MSGFIRPWDNNVSEEQQEPKTQKRSFFDNFGDALTAMGANFRDVRGSERLGDLRDELMNSKTMSDEEYNARRNEYLSALADRELARQQYKSAHDNLVADDSFLKNIDQVGGTLEGMAAQGIGTAVGAGLGFLSPVVGGTAMGAKIGNAAGAVAGGYLDARSVALQAEEEVLDAGGTWEQAKQAYDEALKKASLTTLPETLADIAMGNRLVRAGLSSGVARKIAGSTLGRAGSAVLDPAARLGTKAAFASSKGLVGRGVGLATDIALQGATEAGQEVTQDYIENREVAKALGQQDNEYSLGGFKDFALSPQGLETMKTAGIMGALFGGVGGAVSSGQYLQRGAETNMGIKTHNATQSMVEDGNLKLDKQKRAEEEKVISLVKGISPAQLATWSDADIIAESSVIRGQYRSLYTGEDSDVAQVREAVDATDRLSKTDNSTTREGDLTEKSKTLLDRMGIDNREMFNSPAEKSVIEQAKKANEELQKQANKNEEEQSGTTTEKKEGEPAIKANITTNTAADMAKDENGNITTNENDTTTATNRTQEVSDKSKTDGVVKGFSASFTGEDIGGFKNNDAQGMNYVNSHEYSNESIGVDILASEIMGNVQLKNMETGKIKPFNSPEEAKQYLVDNQNNKEAFAFQEEKQQSTEGQLPENGVDVETSGHTGQLIQSVDDLYNLAVEHPELVNAYDLMEFIRMKQHMGVEGVDIYLNKEKYGYHKDPKTGKYVKVHGYAEKAKGKARAFIQLYRSGDLASAIHEIAHIGYWNLNESDKRTFDYYAIKTQGRYIADMLDENYDDNFVNRLIKLVNNAKENKLDEEDKQLQDKINSHPATRQIQANLIPFYNSVVYNEVIDINNLTKEQQIAIQERWAWEMSQWYIEGYVKGVEPKNIVERIKQRGCASIAPELNALLRVWEHIHHKDSGIESIYRGEQTVENKQEETTSQNLPALDPMANIQFTNELQRQTVPNINMPMSFGGEQTVQYNVPTLGEGYDMAKLRADTYNDALNKQWNLYRTNNLPSADGSVATNQRNLIPMGESQNRNIVAPEETNSIDYGMRNGTFRIGNDLQANPLPVNSMQFNNGNDLGETVAGTSFAQKLTLPAENGTVEKNEGGQVNGQTENTRRGENLPRTNEGTPNGNNGGEKSIQGRKDEGNMGGTQEGVRNSEEGVLSDQKEESFGRKILRRIPKALKQAWKGLGCNTKIEDWRVVSGKKEYLQLFSDALQKSIDSNVTHGVYVDPMSVEELQDAIVILHKSKKAGLAIDKNGTLHGVFKDQSLDIPYVIYDITLIAREMGCVRMDCYGDFLVRGCSELGFTPVAKLNYTDEYIQDRIKANPKAYETQLKERPTVYILVRNEDSNEVARNKIANKQYVRPSKEELDGLPLFKDKDVGYDSAISYGDSSAQIKKKLGKKFNERAVVMATEDARNYYNTISEQPKQVLDAVLNRIKGSLSASKNEYGYPFLLELQKAIEGGETNDSQQLNKEELQSRIDEINKEIDEFVNEDNTKITKEDKEHSQNFESFSNSYIREGKIFREISGFPEDSKPKTKASKTTQSNKQNLTPTSQLKELKVENGRVVQQETEEEDENAVNNEMAQATPDRVTEKKSKNKDSSKKKFTTNDALKRIRKKAKKNNPSTTLKEGVTKKEYDILKKTGKLPEKQEQGIQITDPVLRDWVDRFTNNGVFDFNEASTELYKELDKGNITQKEYDKLMNGFMEYVENKEEVDKVFMWSADNAENSPLTNGRISLLDKWYNKKMTDLGVLSSTIKKLQDLTNSSVLDMRDDQIREYFKAHNKVNDEVWKRTKRLYRGLDGKWKFWFSDNDIDFTNNAIKLFGDKKKLMSLNLTLGDIIKHKNYFKYYPDLKDRQIKFSDINNDEYLHNNTNVFAYYDPSQKCFVVNIDRFPMLYRDYYADNKTYNPFENKKRIKLTEEQKVEQLKQAFMPVIIHEMQHGIQHKEGFATGGDGMSFVHFPNELDFVIDNLKTTISSGEFKKFLLNEGYDQTLADAIISSFQNDDKNLKDVVIRASDKKNQSDLVSFMRKYLKDTGFYDNIYSALHGEIEALDSASKYKNDKNLEITPFYNQTVGFKENNKKITYKDLEKENGIIVLRGENNGKPVANGKGQQQKSTNQQRTVGVNDERTDRREQEEKRSTNGRTLQDQKGRDENQERVYQESADRIIRFMGVSLDRKAGSVSSRDMEQEFRKELKRLRIPDYVYFRFIHPDKLMLNTKKDKNAKRFIKALMKINEKLFENGNVYRGLDGRWRYWIDDRKATFNENVFDLIYNFITMDKEDLEREELTIEDLGLGDEVYKLSEVLNHDEFFKLCPEASDVTVQFTTPEWDRDLEGCGGYYLDGKIVINLNTLRAASNIAEEGLRRKLLRRWLMGVLLHETQHFVQHEDQFARGFNESGFMQVLNDKSRVPDVVDLLIEYKDKILKDEDDKTRYGVIFNNKERLEQLLSSDDYEDYWRQVEIAGMVRKSKLPRDFYYRSLGEEEARFTGENWSEGTTEEKYYIGGESFDLEEVSTAGYLTESGEFEFVDLDENLSDIPKLKERLAKAIKFSQNNIKELQADLKRLQNSTEETDGGVVSRDEALNMTKDEIKSAREEIKVCKKILQKLKEGYEITKREEEIKPKVPMNSEEYFKDLTSEEGDYVHIDKRFQEAKKQKPLTNEEIEAMDRREEKEYEKRKERVEKADEAGELSDVVKDVYSVTFTKSAQNFAENRTRMEYFDNRDKYWDRSEKDGNVTYTRKTPFEHHKKVITYNGANELMQEDKKKSKPAQWLEWAKDQLIKYAFNDMHFLAKAARKLGKYDAYVKMIVTKGYALKANTAMQRGIKYNGKYTRALNDIIKEIGEEKQKDFIEYCIAKRVIDLSKRDIPVYQDMKPDEAAELIKKYESGADAELFMKNQKDFVEYNKALLHVLVDGGIHTEEEFQKLIEVDPNFVPLSKVMDDADMGFNSIQAARSIVNVKTPLKRIGTSFRKVKNPFLEMQKRTAEYYAIASRNKAGQIFVNEIANALDKKANGDTIAKGQGMIRQVSVDEKDGNLITKPDDKQQIIYVCNNGKHEFYQVSDPEIYRALKALDADQMGTIQKMIDPFLHAPSALIRETATMVPDFGVRNLLRDGGEAFLTSEHGFLPFIDQIWGIYQMANNTEWYQRFLEQKGEYGTYNRENANDGVARIEDTIDEKVNPIKNFNEIRNAALQKLTNKKNSKATRAVALLQLMGSMPYAVIKSNKRLNDYLEMGTRIGEFKNAKMGYNGTLDRLSRGGILDWNADINKARQDDVLAAGAAKEITLNFEQYGIIGKQLNRYIPFFNATLQGIYKMCNALELMATGTTLSGQKNRTLQGELLFKAALITAIGVGVAAAGEGDDDYEEANQYEKENFWILPNGLRFPKDQVLGKLFGNVAEKSYTQWRKGKFEPSDILRSIKENFTPDKFIPALVEIALGGMYNYDTFYKSAIVPEYMQGKLGHLQKDLATSNMASDVSDFLWKYTKTDVSAKRLDWALQKNLTNCKKYIDAIYDLGKKAYDPKSFNEKMARGYDKSDSTGAFVGGLKDDIPKPLSLVTGTFATNRTNYKSISDFYERYNDLKRLATDEESMSKEDKRAWKRYEQAYKKDKNFRKQLRAIKSDSSLTGKQKREKADKIFKQQIKLAKWAEG